MPAPSSSGTPSPRSGKRRPPSPIAQASAPRPVGYFYDDLGRLRAVTGTNGALATYRYDAAGNILSIARPSISAVSVLDFAPRSAARGTTVSILGTRFSSTASANTVKFHGVAATVTSATSTTLDVKVP